MEATRDILTGSLIDGITLSSFMSTSSTTIHIENQAWLAVSLQSRVYLSLPAFHSQHLHACPKVRLIPAPIPLSAR